MAIMTCLGIKDIKPAQVVSTVWDKEVGGNVQKTLTQFPELLNKPIGILLAMEEYEKRDNSGTGWSARLNAAFQADTELTAAEILDRKTSPQKLALLVAALRDRPLKKLAAQQSYVPAPAGDQFEDDIPF
jgi:hypothetical protein